MVALAQLMLPFAAASLLGVVVVGARARAQEHSLEAGTLWIREVDDLEGAVDLDLDLPKSSGHWTQRNKALGWNRSGLNWKGAEGLDPADLGFVERLDLEAGGAILLESAGWQQRGQV